MAKISPVSAKYIVHTQIQIEGVVDKPDVIGAIFGQTEGLLGSDLELRELQRSGRIGRIEVKSETRSGKTFGTIIIPSSLDKAETAIVGASLETIQRIGPCNAKVKIEKIEDVRISKRNFVVERAKELLSVLTNSVLPDSQEITDEVAQSVRMMEIKEYGRDRLPAGPAIDESEDIIVVEGRADVLNLLKHGIKNCIGLNGTSVPETIIELGKKKTLIVFVDGDRGGDLIIKGLSSVTEIDYVIKAPDGKEVEEITKKEIHKALRAKITVEQVNMDNQERQERPKSIQQQRTNHVQQRTMTKVVLSPQQKQSFKKMLDDLIGTRGAYILDQEMNILGKVPTTELVPTIRSLNSVFAVVFDGTINRDITNIADRSNVKYLVGMESRVRSNDTRADILVNNDF
jgi:DNA primase|tara:strand:- start:746 stop:1948 length:1203 start_codon:yes stop_codon:yes gene_type:complete